MEKKTRHLGEKGELYVAVQILLFLLVIFGPRTAGIFQRWPEGLSAAATVAGALMMASGGGIIIFAFFNLGRNLTPLPYPKDGSTLVETGAYGIVRHPIYCGGIFMSFGWAFFVHGWLTLIYSAILFIFFDIKSRREEKWLKEKFPSYASYQKKVHKLIPFIY